MSWYEQPATITAAKCPKCEHGYAEVEFATEEVECGQRECGHRFTFKLEGRDLEQEKQLLAKHQAGQGSV